MQLRVPLISGACVLVASVAIGASQFDGHAWETPVSASVMGEEPRFQVTFLFRAGDCRLAAPLIEDLAAMRDERGVAVRGIMLGGPPGVDERRDLLAELDLGFPTELDSEGWSERVEREGLRLPLIVLRDAERVTGLISPAAFAALRAFTPRFMLSEFPGWSGGR